MKPDPLLPEIEHALMPGDFVGYAEMSEFVANLEAVQKKLAALKPEASGRAVRLFEVFLSGCYEKIEECDDSSAYLSMFFHELFCGWIAARQAGGIPAQQTVAQILKWMEHDDYGFCHRIEKEIVKVLDAEGYRLLVAHFQALIDKAMLGSARHQAIFEYENSVRLPALSLKDIYLAKKAVQPYAALCERLGLSPLDCEHLAEMETSHRHWDKALAWVEKGMALEPTRNWHNESSHSLARLRPAILAKLGRKEDALAAAWADFEAASSEMAYDELMKCAPKGEKTRWHERAVNAAEKGEFGEFMDLCVKTKEWGRLATRIHTATHTELEGVSHYNSEPAADALAKRDIPAAAKLYRALGVRILNSKKSKHYAVALRHLQNARQLYLKTGRAPEWQAVLRMIQTEHSRKHGFLRDLALIETGKSRARPSFAKRAKARWRKQTL